MASRPRNVDLGPIYLQVGEAPAHEGWPGRNVAEPADVGRFESILQRGGRRRHERDTPAEIVLPLVGAAEPEHLADAEDIGAEIAHLWVGTGLHSQREVRIGLRQAMLPDTSVRLLEADGRLLIEFTCAGHRVADWLDRKLPVLAAALGERLQRQVELTVSMASGDRVGTFRWCGEPR